MAISFLFPSKTTPLDNFLTFLLAKNHQNFENVRDAKKLTESSSEGLAAPLLKGCAAAARRGRGRAAAAETAAAVE